MYGETLVRYDRGGLRGATRPRRPGTVCGFKENGRIRLRFETLGGMEYSFKPAELAKVVEDKD